MTKRKNVERGQAVFGLLSAFCAILGLITEQWWITGAALGFALAWIILCIVSVNMWMDSETDRIAPRSRHRRRNQ